MFSQLNISQWVKLYGDYLYSYAYYRVNKEEEAQDLVQETFLSALKAKETFRGESNEKTWLTTILKRKLIDYYRKNSKQGIQQNIENTQLGNDAEGYFNSDGDLEGHWSEAARPQALAASASQHLESKEFYDLLNKCFSLLPEKSASVFKMKFMEDAEIENICKEMNISSSNYWIIIHRSKLQLRKCMETN